jgi:hypothetical protein
VGLWGGACGVFLGWFLSGVGMFGGFLLVLVRCFLL